VRDAVVTASLMVLDAMMLASRMVRRVIAAEAGPRRRGNRDREREVLQLVTRGLSNKLIARELGISEKTVKAHLTTVFQRIGVRDRVQAAMWARDHHIA
jgi:DNA-binding NarL/FixJ family response regulator